MPKLFVYHLHFLAMVLYNIDIFTLVDQTAEASLIRASVAASYVSGLTMPLIRVSTERLKVLPLGKVLRSLSMDWARRCRRRGSSFSRIFSTMRTCRRSWDVLRVVPFCVEATWGEDVSGILTDASNRTHFFGDLVDFEATAGSG